MKKVKKIEEKWAKSWGVGGGLGIRSEKLEIKATLHNSRLAA